MMEKEPAIVKDCLVKLSYDLGRNCDDISNFTRYLSESNFCFTIFPQLNGEPDKLFLAEMILDQQGNLVTMAFNKSIAKQGHVYDPVNLHLSNRKQSTTSDTLEGQLILIFNQKTFRSLSTGKL